MFFLIWLCENPIEGSCQIKMCGNFLLIIFEALHMPVHWKYFPLQYIFSIVLKSDDVGLSLNQNHL